MDSIINVITNVLYSLYQYFGAALCMSILAMICALYFEELGVKKTIRKLMDRVKSDKKFRLTWLFVFYCAMVLFKTLFCRQLYTNPLARVGGIWGLYDNEGKLYTENIENILLFVPLMFLLLVCFKSRIIKRWSLPRIVWKTFLISLALTLGIELSQLFLKLGTFQLSDIFFNVIGGLIGGILFWIVSPKSD